MTRVDLTGMPEEDIGEDVLEPEEELAVRMESRQSEPHDGATETSPAGGPLAEAQDYLGGSVCPDDTFDGDAAEEDWEEPERQWSQLHRWCGEQGMILDSPEPEISGGREHDVVFDGEKELGEIHQTRDGGLHGGLARGRQARAAECAAAGITGPADAAE